MNILLLGPNGMLGSILKEQLEQINKVNLVTLSHSDLDFLDLAKIKNVLDNYDFDVLINAVAYTNVDLAETEKDKAFTINYFAVQEIIDYLNQKNPNIKFLHYSTNYVFSGKNKVYTEESDDFGPTNVYGESKLASEEYIRSYYKNFYIVRLSTLFTAGKKNFLTTILDLAKERDELNIVDDQYFLPSYAPDVAKASIDLLLNDYDFGIYHFVNDSLNTGYLSWFAFTEEALKVCKNIDCKINKISYTEYPRPAKIAQYLVLKNTKYLKMRQLEDVLDDFCANYS